MINPNWHPVGFYKDQNATRGWGTLIESVTNQPITFTELVARYNALLLEAFPRDVIDADQTIGEEYLS